MINLLIVNAAGDLGGDVNMWLLSLSSLDPTKYCIHVVSQLRGDVYEKLKKLPNAKIYPMEIGGKETNSGKHFIWRHLSSLVATIRISRLVKSEGIDFIYTFDRTVGMAISFAVSRLTGCPLILSAHISMYLSHSRIHQMVVNHAHRITVVSETMRREFLPHVSCPEKLVVMPNAIHLHRFDPNRDGQKVRRELNLNRSVPMVTLIGRIDPWKGQAELIQAASIVLKKHPETVFVLIGKGNPDYIEKLNQMVDELKLGHKVRFLGHRKDVHDILAAADIATMPSHYEAFGLVALESMAMAKPVVATKAGGVPEFLIDGEMGFLVPPGDAHALADALIHLLDNPEKAKRMGICGRKHVEDFYSFHHYKNRFNEFVHQIMQGQKTESKKYNTPYLIALLLMWSDLISSTY